MRDETQNHIREMQRVTIEDGVEGMTMVVWTIVTGVKRDMNDPEKNNMVAG